MKRLFIFASITVAALIIGFFIYFIQLLDVEPDVDSAKTKEDLKQFITTAIDNDSTFENFSITNNNEFEGVYGSHRFDMKTKEGLKYYVEINNEYIYKDGTFDVKNIETNFYTVYANYLFEQEDLYKELSENSNYFFIDHFKYDHDYDLINIAQKENHTLKNYIDQNKDQYYKDYYEFSYIFSEETPISKLSAEKIKAEYENYLHLRTLLDEYNPKIKFYEYLGEDTYKYIIEPDKPLSFKQFEKIVRDFDSLKIKDKP